MVIVGENSLTFSFNGKDWKSKSVWSSSLNVLRKPDIRVVGKLSVRRNFGRVPLRIASERGNVAILAGCLTRLAYRMVDEHKRMRNWNLLFPSAVGEQCDAKKRSPTTRYNLSFINARDAPVLCTVLWSVCFWHLLKNSCIYFLRQLVSIMLHYLSLWETNWSEFILNSHARRGIQTELCIYLLTFSEQSVSRADWAMKRARIISRGNQLRGASGWKEGE